MPTQEQEKEKALKANLSDMGSVIVAYSGGVDSSFLSAVAHNVLGDKALAVTAKSPSLAPSELKDATDVAQFLGLNHLVIHTKEMERDDYLANDQNRCFFCKDELYVNLKQLAGQQGYAWVANGANVNDLGEFRPGLKAAKRHDVRSPLVEAGLTKHEIRTLSKKMSLPTSDKPAQACLSSRIPYGTPVSVEALDRIAAAEGFLRSLGIQQVRVRHHNTVARIEVEPSEFPRLLQNDNRSAISKHFRTIGYSYVALDLEGFRSGSLNEVLPGSKKILRIEG